MKLRWFGCSALLLVCCFSGQKIGAQERDPCSSVLSGPTDVKLVLSLKDGQTAYSEGEIIPLELAFASSSKNHFLSLRNYDRSGRLDEELFCLTPEARDPLADYFDSGIFGMFLGGGLSAMPRELNAVPYKISEDLNEWKSLPPGSYTLFVVSYRIKAPPGQQVQIATQPVVSNKVRFQVTPAAPEWQETELAGILARLDADYSKVSTTEFVKATETAERALRFLGSEAATRELARRFWTHDMRDHGWNFKAGLIGSAHRAAAIEELERAVHDTKHPATRNMLETLALLEIMSDPSYKIVPKDDNASDEWKRQWEAARQGRAGAFRALVAKLQKQIQ